MARKKLSEKIEEGIYNGLWTPIFFILVSVLLALIFLLILQASHPKSFSTTPIKNCDKPHIICEIVDTSKILGDADCSKNTTDILGNVICSVGCSCHPIIYREKICGWEESYFFFEIFKNSFDGDKNKLYIRCKSG